MEVKLNENKIRGFEFISNNFIKYDEIMSRENMLPTRSTKYSAGYDFYCPIEVELNPHEKQVIWTNVKAYMQENEVLMIYIRSSIGIKRGLILANGTGIIDKDYYSNPDNDGNIGICLYNNSDKTVKIDVGERIAQGIFIPFLSADNGNTTEERLGGIGSTNK